MTSRVLLLGMNNPLSDDPEHALYPSPVGCTGHRLWRMICSVEEISVRDYLRAFDRRNLVAGQQWSVPAAREATTQLLRDVRGRHVVVLGAEVRRILRISPAVALTEPCEHLGATWYCLPHPSGLNRWYNEADNYARAAQFLHSTYERSRTCEDVAT